MGAEQLTLKSEEEENRFGKIDKFGNEENKEKKDNEPEGRYKKEITEAIKTADDLIGDEKYGQALVLLLETQKIGLNKAQKLKVMEKMFKSIEWLVYEGEEFYKKEKYEDALKKVDEVLKVLPLNPDAIVLASKCCHQKNSLKSKFMGPPKPGEKAVQKISGYNAEALSEKVEQCTELIGSNDIKNAIKILTKLEKYENPIVSYLLLNCYNLKAEDATDKAEEEMDKMKYADKRDDKSRVIGQAIPHFTEALEMAKTACDFQKKIQESNLDYSWTKGSVFFIALNFASEAHNRLSTDTGSRLALVQPDQYSKIKHAEDGRMVLRRKIDTETKVIPAFQDYMSQSELLTPKESGELSAYYKARADLMGSIHPKRKSTFWDLYKANFNQDRKSIIELKDKTHARKHSNERKALGIEITDPTEMFNNFAKLISDKNIQGSINILNSVLIRYGELSKEIERKEQMSKNDMEDEERKNRLEGKKHLTVEDLQKLTEKIENGLDEATADLTDKINKYLLKGKCNSETVQSANIVKEMIKENKTLLRIAERATSKIEYEDELPEAKDNEESIDYEVELTLDLVVLESYFNAIKKNPVDYNNYKDLVAFLSKIGFGNVVRIDEAGVKSALKDHPKEFAEKITSEIESIITFRTDGIAKLGAEDNPETLFRNEYDPNGLVISQNPSFPRKPKKIKEKKETKWGKVIDFEPLISVNPITNETQIMPGITIFTDNLIKAIGFAKRKRGKKKK